jgi:hypothetical protein
MLLDHQIPGLDNVGKNLYLQLTGAILVLSMTWQRILSKQKMMVKLSYRE